MANLSDVHGSFTVEATTKEIANKIMSTIFEIQENWEYNMVECNEEERYVCETNDGKYEIETLFYGTGRWCFDNNICGMKGWEEWGDLSEEERELLINNEWKLIYHYKDIELGCEFFCETVTSVIHESEDSLSEIEIVYGENWDLDVNVYTLIENEVVANADGALEYFGIYEEDIDYWIENDEFDEYNIDICKNALQMCMKENGWTREEALKTYFHSELFERIVNL